MYGNYLIVFSMNGISLFSHKMKIYQYRTRTKFYPYKASQGLFVP
jgi:hypothetical protein